MQKMLVGWYRQCKKNCKIFTHVEESCPTLGPVTGPAGSLEREMRRTLRTLRRGIPGLGPGPTLSGGLTLHSPRKVVTKNKKDFII